MNRELPSSLLKRLGLAVSIRVVAGSAKGGRRLAAPDGDVTRPTPNRVREAVFNSLYSLGAIEGAQSA